MQINGEKISAMFGENVFSISVMRERLPKNVFKSVSKTINNAQPLDPTVADVVANAMKDWAIEKGATHYCHWFQPMTGSTAEKHDSFISPVSGTKIVMEFSGKELIQGEPDASSFPSGGLRATFEARGYTAWDVTSPAFIKEDGKNITLFIPCAFCSYTGEALDKKTPLLRSMDAVSKQAMRVLKALGNTTATTVNTTLGAEQEYFLIDKKLADKRLDLLLSGRTLFGAPSPRGQELDDHYFGALNERVASYMHDLNVELWKLGIAAKTQHNEVAPSQYEMAPVFDSVNIATDHNQLTMELMEKIAVKHDLICLLHEKPFAGVNGSGKHVNWSICTNDCNLLDPGSTPHENMQFLVFLCAVVKAVDKYSKVLRASVANAGNEHRLGANEAPPAIISVFLGEQLADIFEQLAAGGAKSSKKGGELILGVSTLPNLPKDSTDRNRTSPFAFTGNKFEFRMCGSTFNTSGPNFVINTIVADALCDIADELEGAKDVVAKTQEIVCNIAKNHGKVVFNGDNYTEAWVEEAGKRGLPNLRSTAEAYEKIMDPENVTVFEKFGVLSSKELGARTEIMQENYSTTIGIEARTALMIAKNEILPFVIAYSGKLGYAAKCVKDAGVDNSAQVALLRKVSSLATSLSADIDALEAAVENFKILGAAHELANASRDLLIPAMNAVRADVDALEVIVDKKEWPMPTYAELLFVK